MELITVNLHLEQMFQPDGTAFDHFDLLCPDWVPLPLYHEMADALKGLERVMAQTVVNCLVDCGTGRRLRGVHGSGFDSLYRIAPVAV